MNLEENIACLLSQFPSLAVKDKNAKHLHIGGALDVDVIVCDEHISNKYAIEIEIPNDYPASLPVVKEVSERIDKSYPHRYSDTSLCLATDVDMRVSLHPEYTLAEYVKKFVVPYFASYEYYGKYKVFPFGERSHDLKGTLEFYEDLFETTNFREVYSLMSYTCLDKYRGHALCPCNHGEKIRNCHGDKVKTLQMVGILEFVREDLGLLSRILDFAKEEDRRKKIEQYIRETKRK